MHDGLPPDHAPTFTLMRTDKSGGATQPIAEGSVIHGVAVDEACVQWTQAGDGTVWRAPK